MAGITNSAFRHICTEHGATLCFTEMVSAKGLSYANQKTRRLLELSEPESQVSVQLFGHEPNTMAEEARWVEDALGDDLASIDVNMGCPARKIVKKGDGSALMKDPRLASDIISAVKKAVDHPVTCKFRRGWSPESGETAPVFARTMQEAGADAVTVHGRYSTQLYQGKSDASCISRVKESVTIPVIGNGDLFSAYDALKMSEETGCDAVMIARGALGNPWIFEDLASAFEGGVSHSSPTIEDRVEEAIRHVRLAAKYNEENERGASLASMRRHAMHYVTGIPGAAKCRNELSKCSTIDEFERALRSLLMSSTENMDAREAD